MQPDNEIWSVNRIQRSSHPEVLVGKSVLKMCSKFTGEHSCRSVIPINLQGNFIEITLWHGCCPANLLHIFRTPFLKNTREMNKTREIISSETLQKMRQID